MSDECSHHTTDSDDAGLVACYQDRGCQSSLNLLVERHLPRVHQLLSSLLLDESLADDLAQEVFLRAIRGLSGFQKGAAFTTWLYRIAMNVAYSHFEKQHRTSQLNQQFHAEPAAREPSPEQAASARELEHEIERALADLSPTLRGAIVLTCLESVPAETAAEIEGCSVSTMYWRIHEARRQLKSRLQRYFA